MDFFEFQQHIEKNDILIHYIINNIEEKKIIFTPQKLHIYPDKVYILIEGILLKENHSKKCSWLYKNNYIIINEDRLETLSIRLFSGVLYVLNQGDIFSLLERENLLASFFYYLLKEKGKELEKIQKMLTLSVKERISQFILEEIADLNLLELSGLLTSSSIAKYCYCSRSQAAKAIRELRVAGGLTGKFPARC